MKRILQPVCITALFLFPAVSFSTNYYISNEGSDTASGLSPAAAWQTIDRLNRCMHLLQPGDTVFFERSVTYYGAIKMKRSGAPGRPIVFTAFGVGSDPVISGFTTISGWKLKSGNIYEAPAPGIKPNLNLVILDGIPQRIGRYPNASAADGGYLRYEAFDDKYSITDKELDETINWTGAEIVVRKNHWTAERCRITKQEGKTIFFTYANHGVNPLVEPILYNGTKDFGYFFQKDARALDENGEWFFDSTHGRLQMVLSSAAHVIKAATIDTLVNTDSLSYISFSHLAFEGANLSAIFNRGGGNISIAGCSFINMGAKGVHCWNTSDAIVDKCFFNYVLSNSIQFRSTKKDNVVVRNCVIKNNGPFTGMGSFFDDRDYKALFAAMRSNITIENNLIDSTGLSGIQFQGSNVLVQNNVINYYNHQLDDGAGIYTFVDISKEAAGENHTNRIIKNNIIINGIGAPQGGYNIYKAEGIYLDGRTMNVTVTGNTIAHTGNKALAMNNPVNISFRNNTCFNNGGGWGATRQINWLNIQHLDIVNNVFFPLNAEKPLASFNHNGLNLPSPVTIWQAIHNAGNIDSNYYNLINPVAFTYTYAPEAGKAMKYPSPLSFEHWQEYTGQDIHSKAPGKKIPAFIMRGKSGRNLVSNGGFDNDINGVNIFGSGVKGQWDNTGKITGRGSLKVECTEPQPNRFSIIHGGVGSLQAGKKYMLRFKTTGNSDCGILRVYLRKTERPFTTVSAVQVQSFGVEQQQHEFVLSPSASDRLSFVIELEKNACIAYFDDIELYEVNADIIDIKNHVRFEYNPTSNAMEIPLDKNYVGVDGTAYSNKLILEPFTSRILIEDTDW